MKHCDFLVLSSSKLSSTPRQSTWPFPAEFSPSSVKRQTWSHADGFSVVSMASHMSVSSSHLEKYTSFPERPLYWFYITNILSYLSYNFIDDIITIDSRINILSISAGISQCQNIHSQITKNTVRFFQNMQTYQYHIIHMQWSGPQSKMEYEKETNNLPSGNLT